jgi:hypothetical protein
MVHVYVQVQHNLFFFNGNIKFFLQILIVYLFIEQFLYKYFFLNCLCKNSHFTVSDLITRGVFRGAKGENHPGL